MKKSIKKLMKIIPLIVGLILASSLWAQQTTIVGVVKDASNVPIIGANILVKGGNSGTITDVDGKFSLNAKPNDVLVVSYIGMSSLEIQIGNRKSVDIVLSEDTKALNEVVVIGYGTVLKKDLTTAVASVSEKEIAERPIISAAQAMQGKAAGVQVIQPSGKPGVGMSVRVRGATSLNSGNDPLYVVDGIPTTDISNINPTDIESMQILKDASSAAIYGSRSANGVVLITTKRGKTDGQIQFSSYYGVSQIGKTISTLNTNQYYDLMEEIYGVGFVDRSNVNFTDWNKEIFGSGMQQNYQLSFSGSSNKSKYFVSGGYQNEDGIVSPANYNRLSFRTNLDSDIKKWLHLTTGLNISKTARRDASDNAASGRGGIILSVMNTPPFLTIWDKNNPDQYATNPFQPSWENPVAQASSYNMNNDYRLMGNIGLTADILPGLKFKSTFSADFTSHQWDSFVDPIKTGYGRQHNGIGQSAKDSYLTWLNENILTYENKWGKHSLNLLAGMTEQAYRHDNSYMSAEDFVVGIQNNKEYMTLNWANKITYATTSADEWAMVSGVSRLQYNFDSKYLLTANLRMDASSKLHPDHNTGIFPSISGGWRISGEDFWGGMSEHINDLKLRAGWGSNGNQEGLGSYGYYNIYGISRQETTGSGPAIYRSTMGNVDLGWEVTTQSNIGLDVSIFNSRITLALDAYYKKTDMLIRTITLPSSVGVPSPDRNSGMMENKGIELQVTSHNLTGKFKWDTDFNISTNKNMMLNFQFDKPVYEGYVETNGQNSIIIKAGYPLGSFYGYISEGVDPETGNIIYSDLNENGFRDSGDRTVIGNALPDFTYGLTNSFSYKNFNLSFFIQGSQGNDIYNASRIDTEGMLDTKNQSTRVIDRWMRPGMVTTIPRASSEGDTQNVLTSSRFVEDGSYLRLKNLTIGYDLDKKWIKPLMMSSANIYLTATNLFTLTNYMGYDPEVNFGGNSGTLLGIDYGTYPQSKSLIVGINVTF